MIPIPIPIPTGMGHLGELARSADMTTATVENGKTTYNLGKEFYTEVFKDKEGQDQLKYQTDRIQQKFLTPLPPRWAVPSGKKRVVSIACGAYHLLVCARDVGQFPIVLYTAGINNYGQLGHGDTTNRHELTPVETLRDKNIVKAAAGEHFSVALNLVGDAVYSWGRSDYGQLGLYDEKQDSGSFEPIPQRVAFPDKTFKSYTLFKDIDAGDRHAMVITYEGEVYTWGFGETGTTGRDLPEEADDYRPLMLDVLRTYREKDEAANFKVLQASGGGQHTLMLIQRFS